MRKQILEDLIPREDAVAMLLEAWLPPYRVERVGIEQALGRVAAEDIFSQNTLPVCRASMGDGIAVRSVDFKEGMPDTSRWIKGIDYAQADTGDDFPDVFDAVVMIEEVNFNAEGGFTLAPGARVNPAENISHRGSRIKEGELLLEKSTKVEICHLASLATGGITELRVYEKPKVVFIPTGNELVPVGTAPCRGQNIDCNSIMVKHQLEEMGAEVICYPIIKDDVALLRDAVNEGLEEGDLVVICGGTAKGEEDYTYRVLEQCGKVLQHGILMAPGRPVAFAMAGNKPMLNIPGPTIGAFYAVDLCVRPLISKALHQQNQEREYLVVTLEDDILTQGFLESMEVILRMKITGQGDDYRGYLVPISATLAMTMRDCNGLLHVPRGSTGYKKGSKAKVELLYGKAAIKGEGKDG